MRISLRPLQQQLRQQIHLLFAGVRLLVLGQQRAQGRRQGGGLAQFAQTTIALQRRQGFLSVIERHRVLIAAVQGVERQIDVAHLAAAAIRLDVRALLHQQIIAIQCLIAIAETGVQGLDAQLLQSEQLVGAADTVAVQITPYPQRGELLIGGVHLAVAIAVQVRQRGKTILGQLPIRQLGSVAEQFGTVVDKTIAVAVQHQKAIIGLDPAGRGADAVAIMVPHRAALAVAGQGFDAIAVQIEDQRVVDAVGTGVIGPVEKITPVIGDGLGKPFFVFPKVPEKIFNIFKKSTFIIGNILGKVFSNTIPPLFI